MKAIVNALQTWPSVKDIDVIHRDAHSHIVTCFSNKTIDIHHVIQLLPRYLHVTCTASVRYLNIELSVSMVPPCWPGPVQLTFV